MKNLLSLLLMLIFTGVLLAQSPESTKPPLYKKAVRFNMLGLLDVFDGNFSFGGEYAFQPRWSVTTDLSFVLYSAYFEGNKRALGYIIKPGIRYYVADNRRGFLEAVVFYKRVGYKMEDWLDKDVVNGLPAYQQYQDFIIRKRVAGLNIQAGLQRSISSDKLLRIEGYIGLGIRFKWQDIKDHPEATFDSNDGFFWRDNNEYLVVPSVPFGIRLVYCIK